MIPSLSIFQQIMRFPTKSINQINQSIHLILLEIKEFIKAFYSHFSNYCSPKLFLVPTHLLFNRTCLSANLGCQMMSSRQQGLIISSLGCWTCLFDNYAQQLVQYQLFNPDQLVPCLSALQYNLLDNYSESLDNSYFVHQLFNKALAQQLVQIAGFACTSFISPNRACSTTSPDHRINSYLVHQLFNTACSTISPDCWVSCISFNSSSIKLAQ